MTENLLIKEKEFQQLNEELKQKAHNLMEKIDYAINSYDNESSICDSKICYSNFTKGNLTVQTENNVKVFVKTNPSFPYIFGQSAATTSRKIEAQKDIMKEISKKGSLADKTVIKLFETKIDVLQNELQTIQTEYKNKCDLYKNLESENKKLETKFQNEIELLKETLTKLENANKELQCRCEVLNVENLNMRKNLEKLQKQIKISNQSVSNYNMRLNRSVETSEKFKSALKCSQAEEKELRNQIRKLQEDKRLTVNNIGKQLSELIQVFKKQMFIINNLKKQNACLITIGKLKFTKDDFSKLLDQKYQCR